MRALRITRVIAVAAMLVGGSLFAAGTASAQVYNPNPPVAVGTISSSVVAVGDSVTVGATNFNPGEIVTGTLFSTPRPLGTKVANLSGAVSFSFSTEGLELGAHHVDMVGNQGHKATVNFTIVAPGQASGVPGGNGTIGTNGTGGTNTGTNGTIGTNGTSGTNGTIGTNGTSGTNGSIGINGTSGTSTGSGSGGFASSIDTGNPGASSGPDGALIGGGVALVLVALGGGFFVARRRHAA